MRRDSQGCCSLGADDARSRHLFDFVFFLILFEESLLRSADMYSIMIAVQLDDVYQKLVSVYISTIIVVQESLKDVVDQLHEGYNGKTFFFTRSMSPALMTRDFNFS